MADVLTKMREEFGIGPADVKGTCVTCDGTKIAVIGLERRLSFDDAGALLETFAMLKCVSCGGRDVLAAD